MYIKLVKSTCETYILYYEVPLIRLNIIPTFQALSKTQSANAKKNLLIYVLKVTDIGESRIYQLYKKTRQNVYFVITNVTKNNEN